MIQATPQTGLELREDDRRRELSSSDPVHTVNMTAWIRHYLLQAMTAQPAFEYDWLANVDNDVVKAFSDLGMP